MSSFQWPEQSRVAPRNISHKSTTGLGRNPSKVSMGQPVSEKRAAVARLLPTFESSLVVNVTLLASGAIAGILEFITHIAVSHMKTPPAFHAFIDSSVVSLMTIALVGVCIASVKARRQAIAEQIRIASDLNHHLRNALQVIANSHYLPEEKQGQAVIASLDRIDEALKRLSSVG
jgi:hypothetical protein